MIVGFAAETNPDLDAARAKLARKGCDLLVVNQVGDGQGFGTTDNEWLVLDADGAGDRRSRAGPRTPWPTSSWPWSPPACARPVTVTHALA